MGNRPNDSSPCLLSTGWDACKGCGSGVDCTYLVGFIACIVIYVIPIRRLAARIDKAAFQYQLTHDGEAYLAELEECKEMPGVKRAVFYDVPAKDTWRF